MLISKVQNLMSLENHIFLQIFIHEDSLLFFQISLKIYLCCSRFSSLLEYSLSDLKDFLVSLWIRCLLFHISWFLEYLLPVSDISMRIHYLLQISWKIYCLLLQISLFTWILTVCCLRFPWMFTSSPKSFLFPKRLTTCSKFSKSESEEVKVAADTFLWTYLYRVPDISINL